MTVAHAARLSASRTTTPELTGGQPQDYSGYREDPAYFTRPVLAVALVEETGRFRLRQLQRLFDENRSDYDCN